MVAFLQNCARFHVAFKHFAHSLMKLIVTSLKMLRIRLKFDNMKVQKCSFFQHLCMDGTASVRGISLNCGLCVSAALWVCLVGEMKSDEFPM